MKKQTKREQAAAIAGEAFEAHLTTSCCPYAACAAVRGECRALAYEKGVNVRTLYNAWLDIAARVMTVSTHAAHDLHARRVEEVR